MSIRFRQRMFHGSQRKIFTPHWGEGLEIAVTRQCLSQLSPAEHGGVCTPRSKEPCSKLSYSPKEIPARKCLSELIPVWSSPQMVLVQGLSKESATVTGKSPARERADSLYDR